jgi:hypothetical protein
MHAYLVAAHDLRCHFKWIDRTGAEAEDFDQFNTGLRMAAIADKMVVPAGNIRLEGLSAIIAYQWLILFPVFEISFTNEAAGGEVHVNDLKI